MGLLLLLALVLAASSAVGAAVGSWHYFALVLGVLSAAAVFVILNDGWYGAGWGEMGVELNLAAAAAILLGTAGGVGLRKRGSEKEITHEQSPNTEGRLTK